MELADQEWAEEEDSMQVPTLLLSIEASARKFREHQNDRKETSILCTNSEDERKFLS
jgi:hypothetical protein